MPYQRALVSVRRGCEVVHVYDKEMARHVIEQSGSYVKANIREGRAEEALELMRQAQGVVEGVHSALLLACLGLVGAAATSLSTALRARVAREWLAGYQARGNPILKVISWVSAAADAGRHLTAPMIEDLLRALEGALRSQP